MIQQFDSLSKENQQLTLLKDGIFLAEREDGPFRIMLYQLNGFYVEVYFLNLYNKVAFFQSFEDTDALQPYLNEIDINSLLHKVFS